MPANDTAFIWVLCLPVAVAALASVIVWVAHLKGVALRIAVALEFLVPVLVCGGLLAELVLVATLEGTVTLSEVGVTLAISPPARLGLLAANAALLGAVFFDWGQGADTPAYSVQPFWTLLAALLDSSLLAGALMVQDRAIMALCLFGAALVTSAAAITRPCVVLRHGYDDPERAMLARRLAGGIKHIAIATPGTGLLLAGALLMDRYALNLENRPLLQFALGLMALGLMVRAGAAPFSAASSDLVQAAPGSALMVLGAVGPAVLVAGLLMLAPQRDIMAAGGVWAWPGAVGVLLAGMRALAAARHALSVSGSVAVAVAVASVPDNSENNGGMPGRLERHGYAAGPAADLIAATAALQTGWALFGVLCGSRAGAVGAALVALNMALAVPLLVTAYRYPAPAPVSQAQGLRRAGLIVGAGSLLGLPLSGGFAGDLMIAQAAASAGGVWVALLLVGSGLTGAGWLATLWAGASAAHGGNGTAPVSRAREPQEPRPHGVRPRHAWQIIQHTLRSPARLLMLVLIGAQAVLFVLSAQMADALWP